MSEQQTIPDWPSLWEREPALRPGHGGERPDYGLDFRAGTFSWTDETVSETTITDHQIGLALCRDAAVRWLMARESVLRINQPKTAQTPGLFAIARGMGDGAGSESGWHHSLDEALFASCVAVLDARDTR